MPRRAKVNIPRAVEEGVLLLQNHIAELKRAQKRGRLTAAEFYQLDRATERLHQLQQETEGAIPAAILKRMAPEDLEVLTEILARYGL